MKSKTDLPTFQISVTALIKVIEDMEINPITQMFLYAALGTTLVYMVKHGMIVPMEKTND